MTTRSPLVLESPSNVARYLRANSAQHIEERESGRRADDANGTFSWPLSQGASLRQSSLRRYGDAPNWRPSGEQDGIEAATPSRSRTLDDAVGASPSHRKGDAVQVRWDEDGKWYPAQILKDNGDGTCIVVWDEDEDSRYRCRKGAMRPLSAPSSGPSPDVGRGDARAPADTANSRLTDGLRIPTLRGPQNEIGRRLSAAVSPAGSTANSLRCGARGLISNAAPEADIHAVGFSQLGGAQLGPAADNGYAMGSCSSSFDDGERITRSMDFMGASQRATSRSSLRTSDDVKESVSRLQGQLKQSSSFRSRFTEQGAAHDLHGSVQPHRSSRMRAIVEDLAQMEQRCRFLAERNEVLAAKMIQHKRTFIERAMFGNCRIQRRQFFQYWRDVVQELALENQLQRRREQLSQSQRDARELASILAAEQESRKAAEQAGRSAKEEVERLLTSCADTQRQMQEQSAHMEELEKRLQDAEGIIGRKRQEALAMLGEADNYEKRKHDLVQKAMGFTTTDVSAAKEIESSPKATQPQSPEAFAARFVASPQRAGPPLSKPQQIGQPAVPIISVIQKRGTSPEGDRSVANPVRGPLSLLPPCQQRPAAPWAQRGSMQRSMSPGSRSPSPDSRRQSAGVPQRLGAWAQDDKQSSGSFIGSSPQACRAIPPTSESAAQRPALQAPMSPQVQQRPRVEPVVPVMPIQPSQNISAGPAIVRGVHPPSAMKWQGDASPARPSWGKTAFPPVTLPSATPPAGQDWRALLSAPLPATADARMGTFGASADVK